MAAEPTYGTTTTGPIGKKRSTGTTILLTIVTLGMYTLVWYYNVHKEMREHTGGGLGGPVALVIAFFLGFLMPFLTAQEVGKLYAARGQQQPVSGVTGLWILLPLVGPLVWYVKTNGALNDYWGSLGAV